MSWTTLHVILGGVTLVGGLGVIFKNYYERNQFYRSRVISEAIEVARQNSELRALLGEPIKGGHINFQDEKNFMTESNGHFELPLQGKIHNATMLVDVVKDNEEWMLDKINIQFNRKETIIGRVNIFKRNSTESAVS